MNFTVTILDEKQGMLSVRRMSTDVSWPSSEQIAAEGSRLLGQVVSVRFFLRTTDPCEVIYGATTTSELPDEIADLVGSARVEKMPIYEVIRQALVERGWRIVEAAEENKLGEVHEFAHPETGKTMAWLDAVVAQADRENVEGP